MYMYYVVIQQNYFDYFQVIVLNKNGCCLRKNVEKSSRLKFRRVIPCHIFTVSTDLNDPSNKTFIHYSKFEITLNWLDDTSIQCTESGISMTFTKSP